MQFQIYGSGCNKCEKLAANVQTAAQALGISCEIEKIADMNDIIEAGVLRTPALGVEGEIVLEGKVASPDDLQKLIAAN